MNPADDTARELSRLGVSVARTRTIEETRAALIASDAEVVLASTAEPQACVALARLLRERCEGPRNAPLLVLAGGSQPTFSEASLSDNGRTGEHLRTLMGPSAIVERLTQEVALVAPTQLTVMLVGETGVGKELVARRIHALSERASGPFIAIDCGALSEALIESEFFGHERGAFTGAERSKSGLFELAESGTLFLDEVANLPLRIQHKLLRALNERTFYRVGGRAPLTLSARIVVASDIDIDNARSVGDDFRKDLYHRLSEYVIHVAPLRRRREDIDFLTRRFIAQANEEFGRNVGALTPEALDRLRAYEWPGNVRELRNVVRRATLRTRGPALTAFALDILPEQGAQGRPPQTPDLSERVPSLREVAKTAVESAERDLLAQLLDRTGGNIAEIARLVDADYKTVHSKIKRLRLRPRAAKSS